MFCDIKDAWGNDPINEINQKLSGSNKLSKKLNLSEIDLASSIDSTYAPIDFSLDESLIKPKANRYLDSVSIPQQFNKKCNGISICEYGSKHLKSCQKCRQKIKKMINKKLQKRRQQIELDHRIKQLSDPIIMNNSESKDCWKNTLIIIIGIIIALIVIFLIIRCLIR